MSGFNTPSDMSGNITPPGAVSLRSAGNEVPKNESFARRAPLRPVMPIQGFDWENSAVFAQNYWKTRAANLNFGGH